jgi:hypothetical protein
VGGGWLLNHFAAGFNMKGIQTSLADVKAQGVAFDVGGTFVYPTEIFGGSTLRLAMTVRNLGSGMKYLQQTDSYPTEWRAGISLLRMWNDRLTLSMDYGKARDHQGSIYGGAEYWFGRYLALRSGYAGNHAEGIGLRAGIGLKIHSLSFDYAYASYGDLGMTHRYEISARFGEMRAVLNPEQRKMLRRAKLAIRDRNFGEAVLLLDGLIKTQPKYRGFRRLYRVALRGHDRQERLARHQNKINFVATSKKQERQALPETDELEHLLMLGDERTAASEPKGGK